MSIENDNSILGFRSYEIIRDWTIFIILFLVELCVFVKINFRIDFLGGFTLIASLVAIIARLWSFYFDETSFAWLSFLTFSLNILQASNFFFIIEIVKIQLAKQPGTTQEQFRKLKYF
jgi:hypothetical protein